jgi:hypothetical protein
MTRQPCGNPRAELEEFIRNSYSRFISRHSDEVREITSRTDFNEAYDGLVPVVEHFTQRLLQKAARLALCYGTTREYVKQVIEDRNAMFYRGEFGELYS